MSAIVSALKLITDSNHQAVLQQGPTNNAVVHIKQVEKVNPYHFDADQTAYLDNIGIESSPYAVQRHPHAISKAIENKCLDAVGYMLGSSYSVVFMKEKKLTRLHPEKGADVELINALITPKDHIRYRDHLVRQPLAAITKPRAFVHDALHYYSLEDVYECFATCTELQDMFATVVIPPEVEHRLKSCAPIAYNIRYHMNEEAPSFTFIPDQHEAGAYEQPLTCLQWLQVGRFVGPGFTLTITKLETWGAHHILQISRGDSIIPLFNYFPRTHLVRLPNIYTEILHLKNPFISKLLLKKLIMYAWSLKEVSYRDVKAKLRQVIPNTLLEDVELPTLIAAVDFVVVFSKLSSKPELESTLGNSLMDWFRLSFKLEWSEFKHKYWPMVKDSFHEALLLGELPDFEFEFRLQTRHYSQIQRQVNVHFFQSIDVESYSFQRKATVTRKHFERSGAARVQHLKRSEGFQPLRTELEVPADTLIEQLDSSLSQGKAPQDDTPFYARDYKDKLRLPEWQTRILSASGIRLTLIQRDRDGKVIEPLTANNKVRKDLNCPWPSVKGGAAEKFLERIKASVKATWRHWRRVDPDRARAKSYSSDAKNGRDGTLSRQKDYDVRKFDELASSKVTGREIPILVVSGRGGCGKSMLFQEAMKGLEDCIGEVGVIVPTQNLRSDWLEKVQPEFDAMVKTYEKGIMEQDARIVILDDAGKLPRGYTAALIRSHPEIQAVIVTMDIRQSSYYPNNRESLQRNLTTEAEWLMQFCDYDCNYTWRNPVNIANALGVYGLRGINGTVRYKKSLDTRIPTLTPAGKESDGLNEAEHTAYTYAGCQGLTIDRVQVNLTQYTPQCSDNVMYTALSRARREIDFVNSYSESQAFKAKLNRTPYLKTFLSMVSENCVLELPPTEDPPTPVPTLATHIPVEDFGEVVGTVLDDMPEKEEREMFVPALGHSNTVQGESLIEQAFPRQQARDEVLADQTIEHRIHPCPAEENESRFASHAKITCGQILAENFFREMDMPGEDLPFDEQLWEQCEQEWDANYLNKTEAALANGAARQDPDFDDLDLDAYQELGISLERMGSSNSGLFIKSQEVLKLCKMAKEKNKPGQAILALKQLFIKITGIMTRYQVKVVEQCKPPWIFINARKTPRELSDFVTGSDGSAPWDFSVDSYASDITEFDDQQDEGTLHFEEHVARRCGIPDALIAFRIHAKLHPKCFRGCYKTKRTTGESETFDGNSWYMIALDGTMFQIPRGMKRVHGGDDMARNGVCALKPSWNMLKYLFKLKIKPEVAKFVEFCSWILTPYGVVKDPIKLETSLAYKEARGRNDYLPALRSYFDSHMYGYRLGDKLQDVYNSRQLAAHQLLNRRFVKAGFKPKAEGTDRYPDQYPLKPKLIRSLEVQETARYAIGHRTVEEDPVEYEMRMMPKRARCDIDVSHGIGATQGRRARKSLRHRLNLKARKVDASTAVIEIHHDTHISEFPDTSFESASKHPDTGLARL